MLKPAERVSFTLQCSSNLEPLEAVWRMLEAASECSIHQTYDWCRAWTEETGAKPLIITATYASGPKTGETAFILPLNVKRSGLFKVASYIGSSYNNANYGVFSSFFLQDADADIMQEIRRQITDLPLGVDFIYLDRQPHERRGHFHPFLYWPCVENQNHAFQVSLDGGFEAVLSRGNAKRRRKKFRTSERRLDELGGYDYVRASSPEEAAELLDAFFAQKAARFEFQGIPDAFADDRIKAFFHRLAQESLSQQRKSIELYAIRLRQHDDFICAVTALSTKGADVVCQFSSIAIGNTEYASPGEMLFCLVIHDACDSGAQIFDFGIGDEQFKRSWCDIETAHYDTMIAITHLGRIGALGARLTTNLKRFVKTHPIVFRLAKAIRLWISPAQR
ncbi:MAG: GNAT family N-acetyltransferase [Hyphomicrobiales bacterium]|nr:GNAT family N-acetyltransferase [Hyphomicrobiales bacterium]MCP5000335.1 GNAT family N-acetyltransferase [Hyphomicrobiales bacterium]